MEIEQYGTMQSIPAGLKGICPNCKSHLITTQNDTGIPCEIDCESPENNHTPAVKRFGFNGKCPVCTSFVFFETTNKPTRD